MVHGRRVRPSFRVRVSTQSSRTPDNKNDTVTSFTSPRSKCRPTPPSLPSVDGSGLSRRWTRNGGVEWTDGSLGRCPDGRWTRLPLRVRANDPLSDSPCSRPAKFRRSDRTPPPEHWYPDRRTPKEGGVVSDLGWSDAYVLRVRPGPSGSLTRSWTPRRTRVRVLRNQRTSKRSLLPDPTGVSGPST